MLSKILHLNYEKMFQGFVRVHPVFGMVTVFVGLPTFILLSVFLSATAITLPMALLFGWF